MNKRGTKILIGCILCTLIVLLLFLVVFRFTQLSCELVSLDPVQLASSQMAAFSRDSNKPVRSYDETIIMKISAYLEYNIQPDSSEAPTQPLPAGKLPGAGFTGSTSRPGASSEWAQSVASNNMPSGQAASSANQNGNTSNNNYNNNNNYNYNKNSPAGRSQQGPMPSAPQMDLSNPSQQPHNTSAEHAQGSIQNRLGGQSFSLSPSVQQTHTTKTEKRFLPLELRSIETRNMMEGAKHKYILNFNCTKINLVMVHQGNRVYVESMSLELRPASRQETTCDVQLPPTGAFTVADSSGVFQPLQQQAQSTSSGLAQSTAAASTSQAQQASVPFATGNGGSVATNTTNTTNSSSGNLNKHHNDGFSKSYPSFAHYYCNKPLRYSCYHYNPKSGPSQSNGILLAELHINGIEFETSTNWQGKHKKVKSEFKSKRSECNII